MGRSVWAILSGLVLAILAAAAVAKSFALPLAPHVPGELPVWHLLRTALPIAAFALPGALAVIVLAEARRVRGLSFWLFAGFLLAAIGFYTLINRDGEAGRAFLSSRSFLAMLGMGGLGGLLYWGSAGRSSGGLAAAIERASHAAYLDENGLRRRCRVCTALSLLLGLVPLALIGWHMNYNSALTSPDALVRQAETHAAAKLTEAGLPWAKLTIDNHVGRVTGSAPDAAARTAGFEKAKQVLAPMTGLPGVVSYLQNDITSPDLAAPSAAIANVTPDVPGVKKPEDLRLAADAKRKADEAAAKAKADEDARITAEAKRKADEAAAKAKAKAEEEARLEAETKRKAEQAAAKAKAAEEARASLEAKRKADEAAAKAKAEEDARLAAEAKRKADEAAAKTKALELQRAEDEKRLAEDLAAQRKADEQKRLELEAQAERAAVESARKAEAAKIAAAAAPQPSPSASAGAAAPLAAPDLNCAGDFSDAFRQASISFGFKSAKLDSSALESIDRIARVAKRCTGYSVTIGGHSDRTGLPAFNQAISERRARAVRDALVARGIDEKRLRAEGYGAQRPLAPANTRAAFRLNRRADFGAALTPAAKSAPAAPVAPAVPVAAPVAILPVEQCAAEFSRALQSDTILFTGSSAIVADAYSDFLDTLARLALSCPTHTIAISGHTDRRGRAAFNQALSQERADAVRDALVDRDVPESRLTATGYGGQRPFAPADTAAAYKLNRRVDFGVSVRPSKSQ